MSKKPDLEAIRGRLEAIPSFDYHELGGALDYCEQDIAALLEHVERLEATGKTLMWLLDHPGEPQYLMISTSVPLSSKGPQTFKPIDLLAQTKKDFCRALGDLEEGEQNGD